MEGRGEGNCVLTADYVRGLDEGREGKGLGNSVLRADCVRWFG